MRCLGLFDPEVAQIQYEARTTLLRCHNGLPGSFVAFPDRFELVEDGREEFDPLRLILWQLGLAVITSLIGNA